MWTAKTDQTGRMPGLIYVFAGHIAGFVMWRLIYMYRTATNDFLLSRHEWIQNQEISDMHVVWKKQAL